MNFCGPFSNKSNRLMLLGGWELDMKIPVIKQYTPGFSKAINYFNDKNEDIINPEINLDEDENDNMSFYYFGKPYVKANSKKRVGLLISTHDEKKNDTKKSLFLFNLL